MQIGIDKIAFQTSDLYLDLPELARARGDEPDKYTIGIGQEKQAVIRPTQDIVTMGAEAADKLLDANDRANLSTLIVATESGIDNSKASAIYIKQLLGLDDFVRTIELKEACYAGTAGIQFAKGLVTMHPEEKILVITADIARYGLGTSGEVTQGGGAVAMLITANPTVLALEDTSVSLTEDTMDFWRPLYSSEAMVDGKYSKNVYIDFFEKIWGRYTKITGFEFDDFNSIVFHLPFTKMGKKALDAALGQREDDVAKRLRQQFTSSQILGRQVGNLYTGSLYLSLLSLLTDSKFDGGERIGFFSYGSGSEGEFFSGKIVPGYQEGIIDQNIVFDLESRKRVSVSEYEDIFNQYLGLNSSDVTFDSSNDPHKFILAGQKDHQRLYETK